MDTSVYGPRAPLIPTVADIKNHNTFMDEAARAADAYRTQTGVTDRMTFPSGSASSSGAGSNTINGTPNSYANNGGGTQYPALNQAVVDALLSSLNQYGTLYNQGVAAQNKQYNNLLKQYDDERARQQSQFDTNSVKNQQNYDKNLMSSIYSGIDSLGGLMSILRGQGAQSGTARDLVGNAVSGTVNRDIRGGADTYDENATALENALNTFLSQDTRRRNEAEATHENNLGALLANKLSSQQSAYNKLADVYGEAGRTADAQNYASKAIGLDPKITSASRTNVADYAPFQEIAQTPTLSSYSGASSPGAVSAGGGQGSLGSGVFTLGDFRRRLQSAGV